MYTILMIGLLSFGIAYIIGPLSIPLFRRLKFGQTVREDGPESHLQKNGTPTMGGFIFIISITLTSLLGIVLGVNAQQISFCVFSMILFGIVGFIDDYIKVVRKRSLGLKAKQKIAMQLLFSLIIALLQVKLSIIGTSIYIPIVKITFNLGVLYIPFIMFVVIALVNSVNLTDGLDGLASSVTIVVSICLTFIAYKMKFEGLSLFLMAVVGGCIGFLKVNHYPAKIFMGDTGSMALGGAVAAAAVLMNIELIVPIMCFVYFMESVSVIIQVYYFKRTGKRFFKMAPIHHHFEKMGWHETKVLVFFVAITVFMGFMGIKLI